MAHEELARRLGTLLPGHFGSRLVSVPQDYRSSTPYGPLGVGLIGGFRVGRSWYWAHVHWYFYGRVDMPLQRARCLEMRGSDVQH